MRDLLAMRFGAWYVFADGHTEQCGKFFWCRCSCGTVREIHAGNLTKGRTRSCGCQKGATIARAKTRHGHARPRTRTYRIWTGMQSRCSNPNVEHYPNYGGRGIRICERWRDFVNFLADMGECPDGLSIDRIDVDGNYQPGNCRWATTAEQNRNQRKHRHVVAHP